MPARRFLRRGTTECHNEEGSKLNFLLSQELEDLIRRRLATGLYQSASEVVEEALHLLEEREVIVQLRRDRLLGDLAEGISQANSRQLVDADEVMKGLAAKANPFEE
jgi:antitoxin ParD1/3/4